MFRGLTTAAARFGAAALFAGAIFGISSAIGAAAWAQSTKAFSVKTADGVLLTDTEGRGEPTKAAAELGLLNLVGWGSADPGGLIGLLSRSALGDARTEVGLTIDSRAQKIAQETLAYHLTRVVDNQDKPGPHFKTRRAAILLLDVATGAVVAAANWPPAPPGAGPAEYERAARERPDPTSIAAWRFSAAADPAGSAFTPLVALAAALEASDAAAQPDARIAPMLLGMDRAAYAMRLGADPRSPRLRIAGSSHVVENLGGMEANLSGPLRSESCVGDGALPAASNLNVSLALKHSTSTYFARLAILLEERAMAAWIKTLSKDRAGRVDEFVRSYPRTRLETRLAQIGLDPAEPIDLAGDRAATRGLARLQGNGMLDKLFADPPGTSLPRRAHLPDPLSVNALRAEYAYRAALRGSGEDWTLTALHLASGAAALARGERVRPQIIGQWGAAKVAPPAGEKWTLRPDLLGAIQLGMKSGTEAPGGGLTGIFASPPAFVAGQPYDAVKDGEIGRRVTALRQIRKGAEVKPIWCRSYLKSGTVSSADGDFISGWAMGWKEPLMQGGRRLAIACMMSHVDIAAGRFGGRVCGSLVRDIQLSLEVADRPDLKAE